MENQLLAFAALLTAWLLIEATQVPVSRLMNEQISNSAFDWKLSLGFIILLPLVTSIYPYIRYNYLPPIVSIRSITSNRHAITVRMTFLFFPIRYNHITPYPVLLLWQATAFPAEYLSRISDRKNSQS